MSRQLTVFMPTPHDVVRIGCITPWSPYPWLHALARITTTLCSCLKPTPLPIVTMTPCHILISLGATTSHDIAPMTPYPCTSVDPAFRLNARMRFPLEWRARFLFEKLIFIDYLKMTWSRHLFLFYF